MNHLMSLMCPFHRLQNGELVNLGILIQYMQDIGDIIIMQWFGCDPTRMFTGSPGIPVSLPHGSTLKEFFPGTLLLLRLGILGTIKANTGSGRSLPTVFPNAKALGSLCMKAVESRPPQEKMKPHMKRKRWSRI